jgi:hypothetical protein
VGEQKLGLPPDENTHLLPKVRRPTVFSGLLPSLAEMSTFTASCWLSRRVGV